MTKIDLVIDKLDYILYNKAMYHSTLIYTPIHLKQVEDFADYISQGIGEHVTNN